MTRLILILSLAALACGGSATRRTLILYPSPTANASQTPYVVKETAPPLVMTVVVTQTEISNTLCVSASVAVYLRPSPGGDYYPIVALPNGARVNDLGGRSGSWLFVRYQRYQGWVNGRYLGECGP